MNTGSAMKDATTSMQPETRVYAKGVLQAEGFEVARVSDFLAESDTVVWVDLCGPSLAQLHELADELGLHELAVEDALGPHQRPKLDQNDTPNVRALASIGRPERHIGAVRGVRD